MFGKKRKDSDRGETDKKGVSEALENSDHMASDVQEPEINSVKAKRKRERYPVFSIHTFMWIITHEWKVLLVCAIFTTAVVLSYYMYTGQQKATVIMSMNYEESAKGKTPNGARFSVSDFRSLDVAKKAIAAAGLSESVKPEQVIDAISITPYSNRSITNADSNYYISSSYYVSFKKPFSWDDGISAEDMLKLLCNAYKEQFYDHYIVTAKILAEQNQDYSDLNYNEIGTKFTIVTNQIDRYLDMRINEASSFVSETGETFKSLRKLVSNLRDYDLAKFDSYIWEKGISKDKAQQIDTLSYINHRYALSYEENMLENKARLDTIAEYNNAMTTSILIPTYDSQNEFYMSRTKTGIDDLAKTADLKLAKAKQIQLDISVNEDKIKKLQNPQTDEQLTSADSMVSDINNKILDIIDKVAVADNEFTLQKTRNYITFEPSSVSVMERFQVKRVVVVVLLTLAAVYLLFAFRGRKIEPDEYLI